MYVQTYRLSGENNLVNFPYEKDMFQFHIYILFGRSKSKKPCFILVAYMYHKRKTFTVYTHNITFVTFTCTLYSTFVST